MELILKETRLYRVKKGQTLERIGEAFSLPPRAIAQKNGLLKEVEEGMVLILPEGNLYQTKGGESQSLLCGSKEKFFEKNGTAFLYPAQIVLL